MNKTQKKIYNWLMLKPSYIKTSKERIQDALDNAWIGQIATTIGDIAVALKQAKLDHKSDFNMESPKQTKSVLKATKSTKKVGIVTLKPIKKTVNLTKFEKLIKRIKRNSKVDVAFKKPVKKKFKRLFFDIETSYNVVSAWRVGYKLNIGPENIIKERGVICVCYKWAGESKVHSLQWDNGDDKQLLIDFIKILNTADEISGHNSDRFDLKWVRTRCIYHGIDMFPEYQTIDTLKLAKLGFNFNSNKLDYLGKFLGFGGKVDTGGFKLWQEIIMNNCPKAMNKMVNYCKGDVILQEKVYNKLNPYSKHKTHVAVFLGGDKCDCSNCGSKNTVCNMTRVTAAGIIKKQMQCKDCGKIHSVSETVYLKERG